MREDYPRGDGSRRAPFLHQQSAHRPGASSIDVGAGAGRGHYVVGFGIWDSGFAQGRGSRPAQVAFVTGKVPHGNCTGREPLPCAQSGQPGTREPGIGDGSRMIRFSTLAVAAFLAITTLDAQQPPAETPLQRVQTAIGRITRSVNATWGIYIKSLETDEEIAIDADRQMETMSTIKIPLMVEAFEQIKTGKFKLTDRYTFVQADSQPGTGIIQRLDPGAVLTVKDL